MKIFSNRFALRLDAGPLLPNADFEQLPFEEAVERFCENPLLFDNQVFYALSQPDKDFARKVFEFQTRPEVAEKRAVFALVFPDENALTEFVGQYARCYKYMEAAGGLLLNENRELLLIYRNGQWDLPKGKLDKGETMPQAALREIAEETGVKNHRLHDFFETTWHVFQRPNAGWTLKRTDWFTMSTHGEDQLVPQLEEGITEIAWVPLHQVSETLPGTFPLIEELIKNFCRKSSQ